MLDYPEIEGLKFKVPELLKDSAKEEILKLYEDIKNLRDFICDERMKINSLDKELDEKIKKWRLIEPLLEIKYKAKEVKEIRNTVNIGFNFHSEINKNIH